MADTIPFNTPAKGASRASMMGRYADLFDALQGKLAQEVQKLTNAYSFGGDDSIVVGQTKLFVYNRALGALYPYVQNHCALWDWTNIIMTEAFDTHETVMKIASANKEATYDETKIAWSAHRDTIRNEELTRKLADNDNLDGHLKAAFSAPQGTKYDSAAISTAYLAACDKLDELTEQLVDAPEREALVTLFENPGMPTEEEMDAMGLYETPPPGHNYH